MILIFLILLAVPPCLANECLCPPGHFQTSANTCKLCSPGTSQREYGQPSCIPCSPLHASNRTGAEACNPCGGGVRQPEGGTSCKCKPGYKKTETTAQYLEVCQLNTCPPGFGLNSFKGSSLFCQKCLGGTFSPDESGICRECPENSYSGPGATECRKCPPGQIPISDTECGVCPPGSGINFASRCEKCLPLTFKSATGNVACTDCPQGTVSVRGATECIKCTKERPVPTRSGQCEACKPGQAFDRFSGCFRCAAGFAPTRSGRCRRCEDGLFSNPGMAECVECPEGTVLQRDGKCAPCPPGFATDFRLSASSKACKPCQRGTFSTGGATKRCSKCPNGTFADKAASKCTPCPKGTARIKKKGCAKCPAGSYYVTFSAGCGECGLFEFNEKPNVRRECRPCPQGTVANSGRTECLPICPSLLPED